MELPPYVFEDRSIKDLRRVSTDATWMVNEILSYSKDLAEGCEHNAILILRKQGLSEQQAVDALGVMFN
ncbi:hypothetical protein SLS54_004609 [Diplodia seriata]